MDSREVDCKKVWQHLDNILILLKFVPYASTFTI